MKKLKLSTINKICSLCLAMSFFVRFSGISFLFFGEPKYPIPEDYE